MATFPLATKRSPLGLLHNQTRQWTGTESSLRAKRKSVGAVPAIERRSVRQVQKMICFSTRSLLIWMLCIGVIVVVARSLPALAIFLVTFLPPAALLAHVRTNRSVVHKIAYTVALAAMSLPLYVAAIGPFNFACLMAYSLEWASEEDVQNVTTIASHAFVPAESIVNCVGLAELFAIRYVSKWSLYPHYLGVRSPVERELDASIDAVLSNRLPDEQAVPHGAAERRKLTDRDPAAAAR